MKTTDTLLSYTANKQTNKQKNVGKQNQKCVNFVNS